MAQPAVPGPLRKGGVIEYMALVNFIKYRYMFFNPPPPAGGGNNLYEAKKKKDTPSGWWTSDAIKGFENYTAFNMKLPLPAGKIELPHVAWITHICNTYGR